MRCAALPAVIIALTVSMTAAASPITDGKKWTNAKDYSVFGPPASTIQTPPAKPNWAAPASYARATTAQSSKIAAGLGRTGALLHNDFLLVADAERANAKTAQYLKSAAATLAGGASAGGKWGRVLSRASKALRPLNSALKWLGGALMAYELWNLAFGDTGDKVGPSYPERDTAADADPDKKVLANQPLANMVLADTLIPGAAYPSLRMESVIIGQVGMANISGRRMIFTTNNTSYSYQSFQIITYSPVPVSTPDFDDNTVQLTSFSRNGFSGRSPSRCSVGSFGGVGKFQRCRVLVDGFPGMNSNSWSSEIGCGANGSAQSGCDVVANPTRKVFLGNDTIRTAGSVDFGADNSLINPDALPPGGEDMALYPEALEPIIRKALEDALIQADDATVKRYAQEAARDITGSELLRDVSEDSGITTQPMKSPLYDYVPDSVISAAENPDLEPPGGGDAGGNTGSGSGKVDQEVETDDQEDADWGIPLINISPFQVSPEQCPVVDIDLRGFKIDRVVQLDPGCRLFDQYENFLRPIILIGVTIMGFAVFRGRG